MTAILLKGTLILAAAAVLSGLLRRRPAALRHLVWTVALAGVLLLPVLSLSLPGWHLPRAAAPAPAISAAVSEAPVPEAPAPSPLPGVLLAIWVAGTSFFLVRLWLGYRRIAASIRDARVLRTPDWLNLRDEVVTRLGMWQIVPLLRTRLPLIPMTWGVRYPLVLLPAGCEDWDQERRRIVLMHELAHVQRRDCLAQFIGQLACALYWFHPLVWVAARQLSLERERACDDRVLAAGTRASVYAGHLLGVARSLQAREDWTLAAITMAHPSQLEGRVRAILDTRSRRATLGRAAGVAAAAALAVLALVSALRPETHDLAGTVYDASGAVVPRSLVTVRSLGGGKSQSIRTNQVGVWSARGLPPGHYALEVRSRGFARYRRQFILNRGAPPALDAVLRVGMIRETITVGS